MYFPRLLKFSILLVIVQLIWACGGGGKKSDTTPDAFSFNSQTNIEFNTVVTSNSITVAGINREVSVSVSGGEYSINGGGFVTGSGNVEQGDTVRLRVTSASTVSTSRTVTLTIGGVSGTFSVTTIADTTPPQAQVVFPSPVSLTDGNTVTVRGKASDDYGPVTSINITVTTDAGATTVDTVTLTASGTDNFISTWSSVVDLATDSVNTISVLATDEAGNQQQTASVVTITQDSSGLETNFPVGNDVYWDEFERYGQVVFDAENNRLITGPRMSVTVAQLSEFYTLDLNTGVRSSFLPGLELVVTGLQFNLDNSKLYFCSNSVGASTIYQLTLATEEVAVISDNSNMESDVDIGFPGQLAVHSDGNIFVSDRTEGIYSVNPETGARSLVASSQSLGTPTGIYLDEANNRILTASRLTGSFVWLDIGSGVITPLTEEEVFPIDDIVGGSLAVDEDDNLTYFVNTETDTLHSLSLVNGEVNLLASPSVTDQEYWSIYVFGEDNIGYLYAGRELEDRVWVYLIDFNSGEQVLVNRSIKPE